MESHSLSKVNTLGPTQPLMLRLALAMNRHAGNFLHFAARKYGNNLPENPTVQHLPITEFGPLITVGIRDFRDSGPTKRGIFTGVIDTGASCSAISVLVAKQLGLTPIRFEEFNTALNGNQKQPVYDIMIALPADGYGQMRNVHAAGARAWEDDKGIDVLLGRDILSKCYLEYIGPDDLCIIQY
jgi:predicted aspartyl protease